MLYTKKSFIYIIMLLMVLLLQGCGVSSNHGSQQVKQEVSEKHNKPATPAPSLDPAKIKDSEDFLQQGLTYYEEYEYREAIAYFDKAIAVHPDNYKVYTAKGIALCFMEEYQQGMALIQKTLAMKPDYVPAYYDMAMAYKLQHQYDQSLYWFEKTIQGDPNNTWSYYGIATIYADRGNIEQSLRYLQKAIELDQGVKAVAKEQDHFAAMHSLSEFQALVR